MEYFIAYDPAPALRELTVPALAVFGELDVQVDAEINERATRAALDNNPGATMVILEGVNHLFQPATTGAVSEYQNLTHPFPNSTIALIADWIHETTG